MLRWTASNELIDDYATTNKIMPYMYFDITPRGVSSVGRIQLWEDPMYSTARGKAQHIWSSSRYCRQLCKQLLCSKTTSPLVATILYCICTHACHIALHVHVGPRFTSCNFLRLRATLQPSITIMLRNVMQ